MYLYAKCATQPNDSNGPMLLAWLDQALLCHGIADSTLGSNAERGVVLVSHHGDVRPLPPLLHRAAALQCCGVCVHRSTLLDIVVAHRVLIVLN